MGEGDLALALYKNASSTTLPNQLQKLGDGRTFEWQRPENQKKAEDHYEAAQLVVGINRDQAMLQLREVLKITLVDFLARMGVQVRFQPTERLSWRPLNTYQLFMSPRVFEVLRSLKKYPAQRAFFDGRGLDINSIKISADHGETALWLTFIGQECLIVCEGGKQ